MFQKRDQSVADLAELLAVARNIRQHVGLDIRLARLAEVDVYEAELAPDRTKRRRPGSPQEIDQRRDQRRVGGGHRIGAEILGKNPLQRLIFARHDKTFPAAADIERHEKVEVGISEARESERCEARFLDNYPELLMQFPDQGLFRPLVPFDLAAGKLPKAAKRLALRALRDQRPAMRVDKRGGGNEQEFHACGLLFRDIIEKSQIAIHPTAASVASGSNLSRMQSTGFAGASKLASLTGAVYDRPALPL
jgi:hypothetical protein